MKRRFALYYAPPPGSALEQFGAAWLGSDSRTGQAVERLMPDGIDGERVVAMTAEPARYGLHGTLKAPFRLAPGREPEELERSVAAFCRLHRPIDLPPFRLARIDGFLALVPRHDSVELNAFAAACVTELDVFRAPLDDGERTRRRQAGLSARQEALLDRWGYPFVLDAFRFHVTLTGRLEEREAEPVVAALEPILRPVLALPHAIDSLVIFEQNGDEPFRQRLRVPLASA